MDLIASRDSSVSACILCGSADPAETLYEVPATVLRCRSCGLVFAGPAQGDGDYDGYAEAYFRGGVYADYLMDREAMLRNAVRRLQYIERFVSRGRLLDAGCATGTFLEAARARGWVVRGLDVSEYATERARQVAKLDVDTGSITSPPAHLPRFEAVTMWDTIEHLERPDIAIERTHDLLVHDGVVIISTGDYGSWLRRLTGSRWRLFKDSTHKFFFDESALTRLLEERHFQVLDVRRTGKWVGLPMVLHQSGLSLAQKVRDKLSARGWNPALYLNTGDVMTVSARRRS
jgi:2-polyprenyl-3-methyl-5-hydroxy-6-metoxy-1,4-benzoquinol methylase